MVSKKKEDLDDFDFDDFNFDEFSMEDADEPKDDRKPLSRFGGQVLESVKNSFVSTDNIERAVKSTLPKGYATTWDFASRVKDDVSDVYDEAVKELRPAARELQSHLRRVTPAVENKLPNFVTERLKRFNEKDFSPKQTVAQAVNEGREHEIVESISTIFNKQAEDQKTQFARQEVQQQKDRVERKLNTRVGQLQTLEQTRVLEQIKDYNERIVSYQDSVLHRYQQKSLEIQYRSYFVQRDQLKVLQSHAVSAKEQLAAIIHNTALPEAQKIQKMERAGEMLRDRFLGRVGQTASEFSQRFYQNTMKQFKDKIVSGVRELTGGIQDISGTADSVSELGGGGSGGLLPLIAGELGKAITGKVTQLVGKTVGPRLLKRFPGIAQSGDHWEYLVNNPAELAKAFKESHYGDGTILESPLDLLREALPTRQLTKTLDGTDITKMDNARNFDEQTHLTLNQIIPTYLSNIHQELRMIRTGEVEQVSDRMVFDIEKGQMTTVAERTASVEKRVFNRNSAESTNRRLNEALITLGVDPNKDERFATAIRAQLMEDLRSGISGGFNPDYYGSKSGRKMTHLKGEDRERFAKLIDQRFVKSDGTTDWAAVNQSGEHFKNAQASLNEPTAIAQGYMNLGYQEDLRNLGVIGEADREVQWDQINLRFAGIRLTQREMEAYVKLLEELEKQKLRAESRKEKVKKVTTWIGRIAERLGVPANRVEKALSEYGEKSGIAKLHERGSKLFRDLYKEGKRRVDDVRANENSLYSRAVRKATELRDQVFESDRYRAAQDWVNTELGTEELRQNPFAYGGSGYSTQGEVSINVTPYQLQAKPVWSPAGQGGGRIPPTPPNTGSVSEPDEGQPNDSNGSVAPYSFNWNMILDPLNRIVTHLENPKTVALSAHEEAAQRVDQELLDIQKARRELDEERNSLLKQLLQTVRVSTVVTQGQDPGNMTLTPEQWNDSKWMKRIRLPFKLAGMAGKGMYRYTKGVYGAMWAGAKGATQLATGTVRGFLSGVGALKDPWGDIVSMATGKVLLVGKYLREGRYLDEKTGKPITKLKDIKGPVIDGTTGNLVLTQEDYDNKFYQKAKGVASAVGTMIGQVGGGIMNVAGSALGMYGQLVKLGYGLMTAPIRSLNRALFDKEPKDVYVRGDDPWVPRLLGRLIKAGAYILKETGKPIRSHLDATKGTILDATKDMNVVIDLKDHDRGLVDRKGNPIDRTLGRSVVGALKWAGGWAARGAKGYVDLVYGAVGAIKDVTLGFLGIPGKIRGMLGNRDQGYWYSHAEKLMSVVVAIHDMMDARMPKKHRKGSWQEQVEARKNKKAETEKEKRELAKEARSPLGRLMAAMGSGIGGALGKLFGGQDAEEDEDDDDSSWTDILPDWMYWGGDKEKRRRRRRAKRRLRRMRGGKPPKGRLGRLWHGVKGLGRKIPGIGRLATLGRLGTLGVGMGGAGTVAAGGTAATAGAAGTAGVAGTVAATGTAATAATAGSVATGTALTGAGAGATVGGGAAIAGGGILGTVALPVLLVGAAVGGLAYFGYRKYKYTANQPIRSYRFAQYGLDDSDTDTAIAVGKLERYLEERSKIVGGKIEFDPTKMTQEENQEILTMFDGDTDWWNLWGDANAESRMKFQYWYFERFNPIFRLWKETLAKYDSQMSIVDLDEKLDAEKQLELLETINRDTPKQVYRIHYSPFKEQDRLPVDDDGIALAYSKARSYVQGRMKGIKTSRAGQVMNMFTSQQPGMQFASVVMETTGLAKWARNNETYQENLRKMPGFMQETFRAMGVMSEGKVNDTKQTAQRLSELKGLGRAPTAFEQLRFFTYGLSKLEVKRVDALFLLEQHVVEDFSYTQKYQAEHVGGYEKYWKLLASRFDQVESDSEAEDRFQRWFERRFLPAALLFASKARQVKPDSDPLKIEKEVENKLLLEIAREIIGAEYDAWGWNNPSVWSERTSPWGADDVLNTDPNSIKPMLLAIQDRDRHAVEPSYPVAKAPNNQPQTANQNRAEAERKRQEEQAREAQKTAQKQTASAASASVENAAQTPQSTTAQVSGASAVGLTAGTGGAYGQLPDITKTMSEKDAMPLLEAVGRQMGIDPGVLARIVQRESAFKSDAKAKTSSASGLFQFVDGTWSEMMSKHAARLGIPFTASPFDPRANALLGAQYVIDNHKALQQVKGEGNPVTEGELYAAHFLGTTGARRMLRQDLSASVMSGMSAGQLRANPQIKSHWTVADFWNWVNAKVQGKEPVSITPPVNTPAPLPAEPVKDEVKQTNSILTNAYTQQASRVLDSRQLSTRSSTTNSQLVSQVAKNNIPAAASGQKANAAVAYAKQHAAGKSLGRCARYVNNSLRNQGISIWGHGHAVAGNLIREQGFINVPWDENYQPMHGDVMSITSPLNHHHNYGHVAIYDANAKTWISDFVQRNRGDGRNCAPGDKYFAGIQNGTIRTTIARWPEAAGYTPPAPQASPQTLTDEQLAVEAVDATIETPTPSTNAFAGVSGGVEVNKAQPFDGVQGGVEVSTSTNRFAGVQGGVEVGTIASRFAGVSGSSEVYTKPSDTHRLMQDRDLTAAVSSGTEVAAAQYETPESITHTGADPLTQHDQQPQLLDRVTVSAAAEQERIDQESQQLASILNEQLTVQIEMRDILSQWYTSYQKRETESKKTVKTDTKPDKSTSSFEDQKRHRDIYQSLMTEREASGAPIQLRRSV